MKKLLSCRRSMISILAIGCLTALGIYHGTDISGISLAIAGIAGSVAGANAFEGRTVRRRVAEALVEKPAKSKVDSPD